jgi:hypothetical protein
MKHYSSFISIVLLMCLTLSACGASTAGPQTWIDRPLDYTTAPLTPLTIMAHASDSEGVANFEFSVNGQPVQSHSTSGARMETRTWEWSPPGPGTYRIEVRAIDSNGNIGPTATSLVIISGTVTLIPTKEDISTETPTNTPEELTDTPTDTPEVPTETPTNTPKIPTNTPTHPPPPPEPPPPADTTPPAIYGAVINPKEIYTAGPGCPSQPRTAESIVVAVDENGISSIYGKWYITDSNGILVESGMVQYIFVNPDFNAWQGIYGPVNYDGTMEIKGTVMDNAGNPESFFLTISVRACIL